VTLAEFAVLVGESPKWVLNTLASLRVRVEYSEAAALRMTVARALFDALRVPLPLGWRLASDALAAGQELARIQPVAHLPVTVEIDVGRIRSTLNVRRSTASTIRRPRRAGRPRHRPVDPIAAATDHGLDVSLLRANLRRSPAQRLRQLDAMADFRRRARRVPSN